VPLRRSALRLVGEALHATGAFRLTHNLMLPGSVSVLTYHGLTETRPPVSHPCFLRLERFAHQMEYLARHFEVVHLEDALAPSRLPARRPLACVTFDDGFASVHDLAFPILERLRIPATIYLVTDLIDTNQTLWFTRLHQAVYETSLPEVQFDTFRLRLSDRTARAKALTWLERELKLLNRAEFASALEDLLAQLKCPEVSHESWRQFRILNSEQIRRMSRDGLIRFGAHTASHQILTRTTPEDAWLEIERSVRAVAALVEHPSHSFAYPNGDFNTGVVEAIRRAGIKYAVSTIQGPAGRATNSYAIPRYHVFDDRLARFAGRVHHARYSMRKIAGREATT
jgi:peptidoglycan/xylan/chitin deacetylase (PgdA/CDA1 family)